MAIIILILKSNSLAKSHQKNHKLSFIPLIISIDLFFAFLSVVLKKSGVNWAESQIIGYLKYITLPIVSSTLTLLHVYLRRLTFN